MWNALENQTISVVACNQNAVSVKYIVIKLLYDFQGYFYEIVFRNFYHISVYN